MANKASKVKEDGLVGGAGVGTGVGTDEAVVEEDGTVMEGAVGGGISEDGGVEVDGAAEVGEASDLLPLAFLGPLNVIVGSSRFQQFFFIYAKLMVGLRLSKVLESYMTPLALHKVVIKAGNPRLEESCWAMIEIWWEMW